MCVIAVAVGAGGYALLRYQWRLTVKEPTGFTSADLVREGPKTLDPQAHRIGELIDDVAFADLRGAKGKLSDFSAKQATIIALHSVTCPLSKRYGPKLSRLMKDCAKRDVGFLVVNVGEGESAEEMSEAVITYGFTAPYIPDPEQNFARALQAKTTTEVFLLDSARTLVYRGAIDDQYGLGYALPEARQHYLNEALSAVIADLVPNVAATSAPGCVINVSGEKNETSTDEVTYHNRISRLVQEHCQACHRDDGPGPFPLMNYSDLKSHRAMIEFVVERYTMPPWFAAAETGPWQNDRRLSEKERTDLLSWIDNGCPEGDPQNGAKPKKWSNEWKIGTPDVVYQIPEPNEIPAEGVVEYKYALVQTHLEEDHWVEAVEVRPSSPEVVHHILVFIRYPRFHARRKQQQSHRGGLNGFFAGMIPGQNSVRFPMGTAKFLPRDAELFFQIHYTPNGAPTQDQTEIALVFSDGPPQVELLANAAFNRKFKIPPYAPNHAVTGEFRFKQTGRLLSFAPHMHMRGKAFRYELLFPDGGSRTVLDLPRYDYNWQLQYVLRDPIDIPEGTRLRATGWYDNSADNPGNPDPAATVTHGQQNWDEMMIGYFHWHAVQETPVMKSGTVSQ